MTERRPHTELATHEVTNQPAAFGDQDLFSSDLALKDAVSANCGMAFEDRLSAFGGRCGAFETQDWSRQANENPPKLKSFNRFGQRLDEVEFHPAYHKLMALGLEHGIAGAAWSEPSGGHLLHGAMMVLMTQADAGVCCPMSMTYASVAALEADRDLHAAWAPHILSARYDPDFVPVEEKSGVTIGMAMTEKQGGSDVRANTTRAVADGTDGYRLTGHKWFCSAPMSDAFLTLAYLDEGLTCFLAPRWTPDGSRNAIQLMRLKDKLGDRSNASSEIEYHGAWAQKVGESGRGVRTIIDMVQHTRYDCLLGSTGGMRAALVQALWHTRHRRVFQKPLIDQPAMQAVLADLVLDYEAAAALAMRIGRAFDEARHDPAARAFARLATPVAKYWICKRQPGFVYEALECIGGSGYVEEGPMPRLFRQSPLNAIWEGSGNVIALDILRALQREPDSLEAVRSGLQEEMGAHACLDAQIDRLDAYFRAGCLHEGNARAFAEELALALQASALRASVPDFVFDAFCMQRLARERTSLLYGTLVNGVEAGHLIERSLPR